MARRLGNLVGVTPFLLGVIVVLPQMVVNPFVLAQSSQINQNSQNIEAQNLYREGELIRQLGTRESLRQALEKYQQALSLFRAIANRREEAATLIRIGFVYRSINEHQRALESYQQALQILREVNDRTGEATTLSSIGAVYRDINQHQMALDFYQQALPIMREVNDRAGEDNVLHNIAVMSDRIQSQRRFDFFQFPQGSQPPRERMGDPR